MRRLALAFALVSLSGPPAALAATGGPDALGATWSTETDGCSLDAPTFGAGMRRFDFPTAAIGPVSLGFAMPFAGRTVTDAWISPTGFVAFSDQGAAGASDVTQLLPDPLPPNDLVAPYWKATLADRVEEEQQGDRFVIAWYRDEGAPFPSPAWLTLFRDGRMRMNWSGFRFSGSDATVAYENAAGDAGLTWWRDGSPIEPGAPAPLSSHSLCVAPPVLLDCAVPIPMACGDVANVALPANAARQAEVYACSPQLEPANERVVEVDVTSPQRLDVAADDPLVDLLLVPGGSECGEAHCERWANQSLSMPVAFTGTHHVVVDSSVAGPRTTRVSATCVSLDRVACGGAVIGTTASEPAVETSYACVPIPLDGPEKHVLVTHPGGHLVVTDPVDPEAWVVLRTADGACLAAGPERAAAWDAPAGDYVITFDNANGGRHAIDAAVRCGTLLDCSSGRPAACGTHLVGDTSVALARHVDTYSCTSDVLGGAEDVWLLDNPREQVVSLSVITGDPSLRVVVLAACDESRCVFGPADGGCALLPAGTYHVVIDEPIGREGPYEVAVDCVRDASPGIDVRAEALSTSALESGCATRDVNGIATATFVNDGADASAPFDVVTYLDRDGNGTFSAGDAETGRVTTAALAAGERRDVDVPVVGTLQYRDSPVFVTAQAPGDRDRTNDFTDSGKACRGALGPRVPIGAQLEWEWNSSAVEPGFVEVESVPLVADLDGDGLPEVLTCTQATTSSPNTGCILRALRGADGSEVWAADAPAARFEIATQQAVADLDGDGSPEIVGQSLSDPARLIALRADGSLKWTSDAMPVRSPFDTYSGAPAIADLDGDGVAEVTWGPNAFRADGTLFWTPDPGGTLGSNSGGPIATIADLDSDGDQEIVAGPTAYTLDAARSAGAILWQQTAAPDGFTAIARFPERPGLSIVLTTPSRVTVLDSSGAIVANAPLPTGGGGPCGGIASTIGGPATIADVDSDGRPDILVVGGDWLACFDSSLGLKWKAPIAECSSGTTSATVFDLDGDGRMEVIHADESALRILAGEDGTELWSHEHTSGTAREMPVVADVDGDGRAEILVAENRLLGGSGIGNAGLRCFGDFRWIGARAVWNQHAYHATNVAADLGVPTPTTVPCREPSPRAEGTFRVQRPILAGPPLAPDLTLMISDASILSTSGCDDQVQVIVRVGNAGGLSTPADVPITAWNGATWLATQSLTLLPPFSWTELVFVVPARADDLLTFAVNRDATGASPVAECRANNDACDVDVGTLPGGGGGAPPAPIGPALRARGHGDPQATDVDATFEWTLDAGAPRDLGIGPAQQHYHWMRGEIAIGTAPVLNLDGASEPVLATSLVDSTPRTPDAARPHCWCYVVLAADACERISAD